MERDNTVFQLIEKEHRRQLKGIELIASENFVSNEVMQAMGSFLTNKYAEGYPGKRYYGGCEVVDIVEDIARERLKKLFNAEWVTYSPIQVHRPTQQYSLQCSTLATSSWDSTSHTADTSHTVQP